MTSINTEFRRRFSSVGWTLGNEGYVQQSFLGCSVANFNVSAGFGDNSSTLGVSLVVDDFNVSDGTGQGLGDDVYHDGNGDKFVPPPVGSPVFFKFGQNFATVEQAWRKTLDVIYGYNTIGAEPEPNRYTTDSVSDLPDGHLVDIENSDPANNVYEVVDQSYKLDPNYEGRGRDHFVFGGILQGYGEKSGTGGTRYNATVVDPREILSNATMILNNYSDSTFNLPNLFNVFGFLEYNPTLTLRDSLEAYYEVKSLFRKVTNTDGTISYVGGLDPVNNVVYPEFTDTYTKQDYLSGLRNNNFSPSIFSRLTNGFPNVMPYTGTSFSRRTEKGIPFYRVIQAMNAMMGYYGDLPDEYQAKGFGGLINFRGFNYIVDFGGIPIDKIPNSFFVDFDQMNLLEFCQEISDVISHDLTVSLLPVIDHPATLTYFNRNNQNIVNNNPQNLIAGVIRVDCIDRTVKPEYGAIGRYIEGLKALGAEIDSSDQGYELSNVATDKFVVGAQEVDLHFFSNNNDRDFLELRKHKNGVENNYEELLGDQWSLSTSLQQQILPFYGFLGEDTVSVPRGFGSYQQIMLDATGLAANGVGNYYVATELELRAAAISFEAWKKFLLDYNELYMEQVQDGQLYKQALLKTLTIDDVPEWLRPLTPVEISNDYVVTVPRSVFSSEDNSVGKDGLPSSPCNPPMGYPLYYKRATKVGLPEAGLTQFAASKGQILTDIQNLKSSDSKEFRRLIESNWDDLLNTYATLPPEEREIVRRIRNLIEIGIVNDAEDLIGLIEDRNDKTKDTYVNISKLQEDGQDNALKVYEFVKKASENLGRKFLVKMPKQANPYYSPKVELKGFGSDKEKSILTQKVYEVQEGPFGFVPRQISPNPGYALEQEFNNEIRAAKTAIGQSGLGVFKTLLSFGLDGSAANRLDLAYGALQSSYNDLSNNYEFNYEPEPQGGFFRFDLYRNLYTQENLEGVPNANYPTGLRDGLVPLDATNLINENSRMGPYVRFDNSQFYNFNQIPKDSFTQQVIGENGLITPDIVEELENTEADKLSSFPNGDFRENLKKKPNSIAFVKCDVDSKFYLSPTIRKIEAEVFGREVVNIGGVTPSRRVWSEQRQEFSYTFPIYRANYIPDSKGGVDGTKVDQEDFQRNNEGIIDTSKLGQDDNHVYALITLPGQVTSSMDMRMASGPFQSVNANNIMHHLTADTVKNVDGFEKPEFKRTLDPPDPTSYTNDKGRKVFFGTDDQQANAFAAVQSSLNQVSKANNGDIMISNPSPIYPSVVALPLRSRERCYGPWVSSFSQPESAAYANIPGKVEFIKDESLSPWAYSGYDLMNEAGLLQAQFSNSLLLFAEKGSFTYPGFPIGNLLAVPLVAGGPLVTNINVDVSADGGTRTTYQMQLYTPSFGKLQKQKQDAVAKISRDRQRLIDQQNALTRKGFGKDQTIVNYELLRQGLQGAQALSSVTGALSGRLQDNFAQSSTRVSTIGKFRETVIDPVTGEATERYVKRVQTNTKPDTLLQDINGLQMTEADAVNIEYNSSEEENDEGGFLGPQHTGFANGNIPDREHYAD